jgi:hypothetical protein
MGRKGTMQDGQANTGTLVGMALGIPGVATFGLGMYWWALGGTSAVHHVVILALCFGLMLGAYLGGLLGMMYVYETGERMVAPPRDVAPPVATDSSKAA